ncbi:MAG: ArnT family glycosyltransferase, partial [Planctomycetota bacterium]
AEAHASCLPASPPLRRVFFAVRPDLREQSGGDTVQALSTAAALRKMGVAVTISADIDAELADFDLVHLWHLERVHETYAHFRNARRRSKPTVLSTIYWPWDSKPYRPRTALLSARAWREDMKNLWRLGRALFGEREGVVAAAILAVYPHAVLFTPLVLAETLFVALLLWGLVSLRSAWAGRTRAAGVAGLALGLGTLVRASLLPGVFFLTAAWVVLRRFAKGAVGGAALMVLVFAATMTPWVVRNWRASGGHFVPTTLRAGPSLYEALNPRADGGPMMDRIDWGRGTEGLSEYEANRLWQRRAIEWAKENPGRALALAGRKLARFWNPVPNAPEFRTPLLSVAIAVPYLLVLALAAAGLRDWWRRPEVHLILVLPVLYHALLHAVFVSSIRYRMPVMPLIIVLAAPGLLRVLRRAAPSFPQTREAA